MFILLIGCPLRRRKCLSACPFNSEAYWPNFCICHYHKLYTQTWQSNTANIFQKFDCKTRTCPLVFAWCCLNRLLLPGQWRTGHMLLSEYEAITWVWSDHKAHHHWVPYEKLEVGFILLAISSVTKLRQNCCWTWTPTFDSSREEWVPYKKKNNHGVN